MAKGKKKKTDAAEILRRRDVSSMEAVFPLVMELLRRDRGLTVDQLADELGLDRA